MNNKRFDEGKRRRSSVGKFAAKGKAADPPLAGVGRAAPVRRSEAKSAAPARAGVASAAPRLSDYEMREPMGDERRRSGVL